jgi:hypothetical protein
MGCGTSRCLDLHGYAKRVRFQVRGDSTTKVAPLVHSSRIGSDFEVILNWWLGSSPIRLSALPCAKFRSREAGHTIVSCDEVGDQRPSSPKHFALHTELRASNCTFTLRVWSDEYIA